MYATVEKAIEELKLGKAIIVVDDEDRENEGDFVALGEFATPKMINFMATEGRGLICVPIEEEKAAHHPVAPWGRRPRSALGAMARLLSLRQRSSGATGSPRSIASIVSATS